MERCLNFFVKGKSFCFYNTYVSKRIDLTLSELIEIFIDNPCRGICVILPNLKSVWILFHQKEHEWLVYDTTNKLRYSNMVPLLDHDCLNILPKSPSKISFNVLPLITATSNVKHLCTLRKSLSHHLCYGFINNSDEYVVFEHPLWSVKPATVVITDPLTFVQTYNDNNYEYANQRQYWMKNMEVVVMDLAPFVTFNDTFVSYVRALIFWTKETPSTGCETYVHNRDIYFCWLWPFVRIKYFKENYLNATVTYAEPSL